MQGKPPKKTKTSQSIFTLAKVRESMPDFPEIRMLGRHPKQRGQGRCRVRHRAEGTAQSTRDKGQPWRTAGQL